MDEKRLIDANALCQHIQDWKTRCQELHRHSVGMYHMMIYDVLCQVLDVINDTPTVDPESLRPKTSMKYDASTRTVTCQNWHPASEIPLLHHEVDENKCEGTIECDVSEQLLLYTEEEGYKVGVYMKDCYGFDGWLNPDYGGTIRHVVEWQYPPKPSKEKS